VHIGDCRRCDTIDKQQDVLPGKPFEGVKKDPASMIK
jgi:hypothetical protein